MALLPFLQKEKDLEEGKSELPPKKIDFAQKLPTADLEGKPAPKGGSFDFLKSLDQRQPGEKAPVKITKEVVSEKKEDSEEDLEYPEESKKGNFFNNLLNFKLKLGGGQDSSQVLEVNLVKDEIIKFFDWQRGILVLLIAVFGSFSILSGIYWGISWWGSSSQNLQGNNYVQQYYKVSKAVSELEPRLAEVLAFKAKLEQADFLLARHIYWTNFFSFLENNTLSNVTFSQFGGPITESYSLAATTDSLDAINAQIKKLMENPEVSRAEVDSGTVSGEKGKPVVLFNLSFDLSKQIFLK
jgi:hypothetical protein